MEGQEEAPRLFDQARRVLRLRHYSIQMQPGQPDIPRSGKRGQFCHLLVPPANPRTPAQVGVRRLLT